MEDHQSLSVWLYWGRLYIYIETALQIISPYINNNRWKYQFRSYAGLFIFILVTLGMPFPVWLKVRVSQKGNCERFRRQRRSISHCLLRVVTVLKQGETHTEVPAVPGLLSVLHTLFPALFLDYQSCWPEATQAYHQGIPEKVQRWEIQKVHNLIDSYTGSTHGINPDFSVSADNSPVPGHLNDFGLLLSKHWFPKLLL